MRLYQGLALEPANVQSVMDGIRRDGIQPHKGGRRSQRAYVADPKSLIHKTDLSVKDSAPADQVREVFYATGDLETACFYAFRKDPENPNREPVVIEFEADSESVCIDGNDLLYLVFGRPIVSVARPYLQKIYGEEILSYAEQAWSLECGDTKSFLYCDLARHDRDVINAHYRNKIIVGGKVGVRFRSSFMVDYSIPPENIISVYQPASNPKWITPDVAFEHITTSQDDHEANLKAVKDNRP